jgi:hypothetical protein
MLLREGDTMRAVHEHHEEGLFSVTLWRQVLEEVGFVVEVIERDLGEELGHTGYSSEIFLCRRPNPETRAGP